MGLLRRRVFLATVLGLSLMAMALGAASAQAKAGAKARGAESSSSTWQLSTSKFENRFDAEPYTGNGYMSQRIPAAGEGFLGNLGTVGWPLKTPRIAAAMVAGLYANTDASNFYPGYDKQVIALVPTWSTLDFAAASGTYSAGTASAESISDYRQTEDLRSGTITTSGTWTAPGGERADFEYKVFTDRAREHVGVVSLRLTPHWSGQASVTSLLDGSGAARLEPAGAEVDLHSNTSTVASKALGTGTEVVESARLDGSLPSWGHGKGGGRGRPQATAVGLEKPQTAGEKVTFPVHSGRTYVFTKYVAIADSRDSGEPAHTAALESARAKAMGAAALEGEDRAAWTDVWQGRIKVAGDPSLQTAINANAYDLYASMRPDSPDAIGPTGLSSDGYAGMIFWDSDIWMFPALLASHPEIAKADVDYRFNTLAAAEHDAAANGYKGAFYPWTAGDDGYTGADCYGTVTDGNDKIISDPNKSCSEELHLQADIAISQWEYYEATGDKEWLASHGWPVLKALAEFWVSKATPAGGGGYSIDTVQPPDESHTDVNNSTYTNAAAATALRDAIAAAGAVGQSAPGEWAAVAEGLTKTMPFNAGENIYEEFEGYEGDEIKQADVVMLTYPLDFPLPEGVGLADLDYYAPRTSLAGPAMTDAIHAIDSAALNAPGCSAYTYMQRSYEPFLRQPFDQFAETRSGSETAFNFLTGVGGFMQVFEYGFSGLRFGTESITLDPMLPPQMHGVTLTDLKWQGRTFTVTVGPQNTTVDVTSGPAMPIETPEGKVTAVPGQTTTLPTRRPDLLPTPDLARCRPAEASSSVPGDNPVAAVDGSPATPWQATEPAATLTVHIPAGSQVSKVSVKRGNAEPFPYTVEVSSDGSNWQTVGSAPATSPTGTDTFEFGPTAATLVRLNFPGGGGSTAPLIDEVRVEGT